MADATWQRIDLPGAELRYCATFWSDAEALLIAQSLREEIAWEQHHIAMFGRTVAAPRLSSWIGDADAVYTYSRTRFAPRPWTPRVVALRARVAAAAGEAFNSVLANLYRDGADSMGWHSDDEPELGPSPVIASASFGAARRFLLQHKRDKALRYELALASGSLLVMAGATQKNYRHSLPKSKSALGERINLTFRRIVTSESKASPAV